MRPLAIFGAATVIAGFLVIFQRGLAGLFDFSYTFVTLVGVLAGIQGLRYAMARRSTEPASVELGDPERRYVVESPGADVDDQLRRASSRSRGGSHFRRRLRDRLRDAARDELVATRNISPERAEAMLSDGSWTEDPAAAAFLEPAISYPISVRLRAGVRGEPTFRYGMRHAVTQLRDADSDTHGGQPTQ